MMKVFLVCEKPPSSRAIGIFYSRAKAVEIIKSLSKLECEYIIIESTAQETKDDET